MPSTLGQTWSVEVVFGVLSFPRGVWRFRFRFFSLLSGSLCGWGAFSAVVLLLTVFFFLLSPCQNFVSIWFPLIFVVCAHTFVDLRSLGRSCWQPRGGADEPYSSISRGFHSIFHGGEASLNLLAESLQSRPVVFRVIRLSFPSGTALSDLDVVHVEPITLVLAASPRRSFLLSGSSCLVLEITEERTLRMHRVLHWFTTCRRLGQFCAYGPVQPCFIACNSSVRVARQALCDKVEAGDGQRQYRGRF